MSNVAFTNAWSADEQHITTKISTVTAALRNGLPLKEAFEALYIELESAPPEHIVNYFSVLILSVAMDNLGEDIPDTVGS